MDPAALLPLHVPLPGLDALLPHNFLIGKPSNCANLHSHPCYELVCFFGEDGARFVVVPPRTLHSSVFSLRPSDSSVCSLLFSFPNKREKTDDDVCAVLQALTATTDVVDTFGGAQRLDAVRQALEDDLPGRRDKLAAELRLLFVDLARALSVSAPREAAPFHSPDEERLYMIESFFAIGYADPSCNKKQLAAEISVSERQLTRILADCYHNTFRAILVQTRMGYAEDLRKKGTMSAADIAYAVGYRSLPAFRRAYAEEFGKPFRSKKNGE